MSVSSFPQSLILPRLCQSFSQLRIKAPPNISAFPRGFLSASHQLASIMAPSARVRVAPAASIAAGGVLAFLLLPAIMLSQVAAQPYTYTVETGIVSIILHLRRTGRLGLGETAKPGMSGCNQWEKIGACGRSESQLEISKLSALASNGGLERVVPS